ncbi:protein kinase [Myxococcaceae bacterium GXIMD 01537]
MESAQNAEWVGRYRLSARIATGGMAEVYLGRRIEEDGARGPSVAVKRLLPHLVTDRRIVQMFLNEARITEQIRHPNVVQILELGMQGNEPFIAMELLEGRSFAEVRQEAAERGQRVPLGITLRVLADACRGLDAAHRSVDEAGRPLRIVHRDFTPDNIHVGVNGAVKVIDFGIAKADSLGSGTEPGTLKGKFFYMSPEMIVGRPVDHRADLFAAGVMLYEQLCGRRPFTGLSTEEVLARIAEGRPRSPRSFDPSVPEALDFICLTALHREPEARFESLEAFIDAIESVGGPAEVATPQQLAAYVEQLFPLETDSKRQTLRRARQADPSNPARPPLRSLTPPAPSPAPVPTATVSMAPAQEAAPPPAAPSRSVLPKVAAALGVALLLGGGALLALRPKPPPAERIAVAQAAEAPAAKVSALAGLGEDPRATGPELGQASALLAAAGAYPEALTLAEAYVRRVPSDVEAHLLAARAATGARMGKRAEKALEEATRLAPDDVRPPLALAELREKQGDLAGAIGALAKAYEKRPQSTEVTPRYGRLLSHAGRLEEAEDVLVKWTRRNDDDAQAHAELGYVRFRQQRVDEAVGLLRKALRKDPKLAVAHLYLGAVLFRKGETGGAERAYREADRLAPEDPRALAARCQLHATAGDMAAVEEAKRTLRERFPERAEALAAECKPASPL